MRKIKKYANRKFYDTTEKKYVSLDELAALIKAGEEVAIEDNETGEDLTASVIAQLLAKDKEGNSKIQSGILADMLRKGGGTVIGYAKRYTALWQNALTMAEDEVDKLVNVLVKDKEISESEGNKLKKELQGYADDFKSWISDKIDQRINADAFRKKIGEKIDQQVNEVMKRMNLASKEQILSLTAKIEALTETVEKLEKAQAEKVKSDE